MSCLSCFRGAPDSPQSFYTAGGASFRSGVSLAQTFVSAQTAFASPQASLPDRSPPPLRARNLNTALEEAVGADVVVGRPFSASAVSSEGDESTLAHEEPLTSHPLRSASPSPTKSVTREVAEEQAAFKDVDLASSPSPRGEGAAPQRSVLGDVGNAVRSVFGGRQKQGPAAGVPAAAVVGGVRARAFADLLFGEEA